MDENSPFSRLGAAEDTCMTNSLAIARLDERLKNIEKQVTRIEAGVKDLNRKHDAEMDSVSKKLSEKYVTTENFLPYQRAIITAISTVVIGVLMAVLNLVLKQ